MDGEQHELNFILRPYYHAWRMGWRAIKVEAGGNVALVLFEQPRFVGRPSNGGGDGNVEKPANLWYHSDI